MKYGVRFEESLNGVGAHLPDVPGVAVVGDDLAEALSLLDKALQWHIEALIEDGSPLPEPTVDESGYTWFLIPERPYIIAFSDAMRPYVVQADNVASLWPTHGDFRLRSLVPALELSSAMTLQST